MNPTTAPSITQFAIPSGERFTLAPDGGLTGLWGRNAGNINDYQNSGGPGDQSEIWNAYQTALGQSTNPGLYNPNPDGSSPVAGNNAQGQPIQAPLSSQSQALQSNGAGAPLSIPDTSAGSAPNQSGINSAQTSSTGTGSADNLFQQYMAALGNSSDVTNVQNQLANLQQSQYLSHQGLEGQPIATPFVTGQEAAVDKGLNQQQTNLTNQLSLAQAKRQSGIDVSKAALDYATQKEATAQALAQHQADQAFTAGQNTQSQNATAANNTADNAAALARQQAQAQATSSTASQKQQADAALQAQQDAAALARTQATIAGQNKYITLPDGSQLINTQAPDTSGNAQLLANQAAAAKLGISIPGVGGSGTSSSTNPAVVANNAKDYAPKTPKATTTKGTLGNATFVNQALTQGGWSYDKALSSVPSGQIGVIDNSTGAFGYINPKDYSASKYTKI